MKGISGSSWSVALVGFLCLIIASCTGGGGGGGATTIPSSSSHTPVISALTLAPNYAVQNQGDGEAEVSFNFDIADSGGDIALLTLIVYDAQHRVLFSGTDAIQGAAGITSGYINGTFFADTTTPGNYSFEFYVTDAAGVDSNHLTSSFTITPPESSLVSIKITPVRPVVAIGTTQQLVAMGTYQGNITLDLTNLVTWWSWDTGTARINSTGLVTATGVGWSDISASMTHVSDSTTIYVTSTTVSSILVTPINTTIGEGATQQYRAVCTFLDNTTSDLTTWVTWTSTDETKATINSSGLATGLNSGMTNIVATLEGVFGSTSLKIVPSFARGVQYPTDPAGIFVGNTAMGDLNGDGRIDVAVLEGMQQPGSRILIYYQNTQGTFNSPQVITTELNLRGVVIADVNNDGFADLIVSGNSTTATSGLLGRIAVLRQNATTHILGIPQYYSLSTNNVGPLAVADLNGDGLLDIVAAGEGSGTNGVVSFLFQDQGGGLDPEVTYTNVPVVADGELHVADMNNDVRRDIVLQSGPLQFAVIKQTSAGIFSTIPDFYTIQNNHWPYFRSFALGDLNGDGRADVVVADGGNDGYLNIFLQNANGGLTGPTRITIDLQTEVHIADVDRDGLNDLIVSHGGTCAYIYYQFEDHSFQNRVSYCLPTNVTGGTLIHQALSIGDVTGDGLPDIVMSWFNEGIYVLRQLP